MTAPELKGKLGFAAALPLAFALAWAHGLRAPGALALAIFASGVLVPVLSLLLGAVLGVLSSLALAGPFTLREGTVEGLNEVLGWVTHLVAVAVLTFGVVAVVARVVTPSVPPDLRLWELLALAGRGVAALAAGWFALATLLEVRRRAASASDLRAARALAAAGRADAAVARCDAALRRWEDRPLIRAGAALDLALLRASLLVGLAPEQAAAAFADLAEVLAWSPEGLDRVARAADAAGLSASALQAWMFAARPDPDTRDRALDEVGRRAEGLPTDSALRGAVLQWLRDQAAQARDRRDRPDLEALARLAERLEAPLLAREVRQALP